MPKVRYQFNTKSLSYEKVKLSFKERFVRLMSFVATGVVFGALGILIAYNSFQSPREKMLQRELDNMKLEYEFVNQKIKQLSLVLSELQERDNNIYRVIFEADPIPDEVRMAGFGGVNRYEKYKGFRNSDLIIESLRRADILSKQLVIQSKSYDEIYAMVLNKAALLASIPAIQPVSNKNLKYMSSGFGYRTDPIYKTTKFHAGMDFSAPIGTPIYATGNGTVLQADNDATGYGLHVRINHGYGYLTLYAHMSKTAVRVGQKVKRGDLIGYVGNTGKSVGPHLHYEVHKNGIPVNPVNFFFNDLSPEEYERMIFLANQENQALD
ncbi:MAG: M23 family metallopeptidase [Flavobacteriales bacterium]